MTEKESDFDRSKTFENLSTSDTTGFVSSSLPDPFAELARDLGFPKTVGPVLHDALFEATLNVCPQTLYEDLTPVTFKKRLWDKINSIREFLGKPFSGGAHTNW